MTYQSTQRGKGSKNSKRRRTLKRSQGGASHQAPLAVSTRTPTSRDILPIATSAKRASQTRREMGLQGGGKVTKRRGSRSSKKDDEPQQSFVEIAYDKTAAAVTTVKDLFVSGLTKIKGLINTAREKSRTSRTSRGRSRRQGESLSDDSSLDRYRTPMGRSKSRAQSRGFSKVVPLDAA